MGRILSPCCAKKRISPPLLFLCTLVKRLGPPSFSPSLVSPVTSSLFLFLLFLLPLPFPLLKERISALCFRTHEARFRSFSFLPFSKGRKCPCPPLFREVATQPLFSFSPPPSQNVECEFLFLRSPAHLFPGRAFPSHRRETCFFSAMGAGLALLLSPFWRCSPGFPLNG